MTVKLPMIVPPTKYVELGGHLKLGGYLLHDELYADPIIISNPNLNEKSEISRNNIIYDMINNINSVSFKINEEVLDFILKYYKEFNLIIDPGLKHPLESKEKLNSVEKIALESFNSKQNLEFEILNIAQIFKNSSNLYLPSRLDYRGRLYCTTEYLNYQGIEYVKLYFNFLKVKK